MRQILEAAERSVSEMRARANEEASEHVARVQDAADGMLAKLDDLEAELGNLLAALRASGERLIEGLADAPGRRSPARGDAEGAPRRLVDDPVPPAAEEDFAAAAPAPVVGRATRPARG